MSIVLRVCGSELGVSAYPGSREDDEDDVVEDDQ
jgi:hypothetical protein